LFSGDRLRKSATKKWARKFLTQFVASATATVVIEMIKAAVMGGHPQYIEHRAEWLKQLSREHEIPLEALEKVADRIENAYAPWVRVAKQHFKS